MRLAVNLMLAIARNHPFAQRNKRTGFLAGGAFLAMNGYSLVEQDNQAFADLFVVAVQDHGEPDGLEAAVRQRLKAVIES